MSCHLTSIRLFALVCFCFLFFFSVNGSSFAPTSIIPKVSSLLWAQSVECARRLDCARYHEWTSVESLVASRAQSPENVCVHCMRCKK